MIAQTTLLRKIGQIHQALLQVSVNGALQSNLSPTLKIIRLVDKFYLDFTDINNPVWVNSGGINKIILPEVKSDNIEQGIYSYSFNPLDTIPPQQVEGGYLFLYNCFLPVKEGDTFEYVEYRGVDDTLFNVKRRVYVATIDDIIRNIKIGMLDFIDYEYYEKLDTSMTYILFRMREFYYYDSNCQ